jgi:hypothetical protein
MECSISQTTGNRSRRVVGRVLGAASAALLFAAAIIQPQVVNADDGEFHGGGFHHRLGVFRTVFGFGGVFPPFWWSPFWWFYGYPFYDYPDHRYYGYDPGSSYYGNYPDSGYGLQPNARQTWHYCSNPRWLLSICDTLQHRVAVWSRLCKKP